MNKPSICSVFVLASAALTGCSADPQPEPHCTPAPGTICTVAGNDVMGLSGDGGPAIDAELYWPMDMTIGPDGLRHIVDWNNHRIRGIDPTTGFIRTIAGVDGIGDGPEGPALDSHFNHPTQVVFDPDGNMLIAAWHNSKIKHVDMKTMQLSDTCGDGLRAYKGDGGLAKTASFDLTVSMAFGKGGELYILDQANQRIRMVDDKGVVSNFAGDQCIVNECAEGEVPEACDGSQKMVCNKAMNGALCKATPGCIGGFAGDGETADKLRMKQPVSQSADPGGRLLVDAEGNVIFTDILNHRVRKIDGKTKVVSTIVGSGEKGYGGDGGDATKAKLNRPSDLALGPDGTLYIADTYSSCVRAVKDGTISTYAGVCGEDGFEGDGASPTTAKLNRPYGIEVDKNGDLYIADTFNGRVRVVKK
jgi:DNA-binding beta-propeller fold protein YncE